MLKLITVPQFYSNWLNAVGRARRWVLCAAMLMCSWSTISAYDVSLEAGSSIGAEEGLVPATALLSRIGTSGSLPVSISIAAGSSAIWNIDPNISDYVLEWYNSALLPTPGYVSFASATDTVVFQPGEASVEIRLRPRNDGDVEGREYVILNINSSTNYNTGQYPSRRLTIADNDHQARIQIIQPVADEDIALRGDPDDSFSRRRGIARVQFDSFDPTPLVAGDYLDSAFSRNLVVQFLSTSGTIPSATLNTDYAVKYKISGHSNDVTTTDTFSQIGRVYNGAIADGGSNLSITTGLNYRLMAAITGDFEIPLKEQVTDDLTSINTIPIGAVLYFESDPTRRAYTVTGSGPASVTVNLALNRPIPSGTKVKITSLPPATEAPDSVIVERTYPQGSIELLIGEGFGDLYEGDVIKLAGDDLTYVITSDPNLTGTGRRDARIDIFAFEGGSGGGIFVAQTTAAEVTTLITPRINSDGELQLLIPYNSTKLEISIEPVGAGDGAEKAEAVRMRMIADEDYIILSPQDALITIADRDVVAGVTVQTSAGLPNIEGSFRFSLSKPYATAVKVPFRLTGLGGGALVGEATTFETLPREVTFVAGQTTLLLPIRPISGGLSTSIVLSLLGTEDYKLGGSTSSSLNPSATMHINDVIGVVTITAPTAAAIESNSSPTNGLFRVSVARNSGQVGAVALRLSVSGTATNGSRYEFFNISNTTQTYSVTSGELTQIQIPAGSNSVDIGVRPNDNQVAEGSESVQLALNNQGTDYSIGTPNAATITIQDNEPTISATLVTNAGRPSTAGVFRFSYPGVPTGQAVSQAVVVKYTFTGAVQGTDFQSSNTVTIQPNTLSTDLTINPIVTGTATGLTVTVTPDSTYHVSTVSPAATMSFTAADPETSVSDNKTTPGAVSSGASGGGCGLGSGVAAFILLGLFGLFAGLRRRQE